MERTTFGLLFYIRRTKLNKSGEASIFLRITVNGERADAGKSSVSCPLKPKRFCPLVLK